MDGYWAGTPLEDPSSWPDHLRAVSRLLFAIDVPSAIIREDQFYPNTALLDLIDPPSTGVVGRRLADAWPAGEAILRAPLDHLRAGSTQSAPEALPFAPLAFILAGLEFACSMARVGSAGDEGSTFAVFNPKRPYPAIQTDLWLSRMLDGIPQLVWRANSPANWTWSSPQWTAFTGFSIEDSQGLGWLRALHPDDRETALACWAEASVEFPFHADYRVYHLSGDRYRWCQTKANPVLDEAGGVIEWVGTSTDVDELRQLQAHKDVLVAELQHRTRNLISVVRSVATRIASSSRDLAEFGHRFQERLDMLSRVQSLLSRLDEFERVTFDELLRSELAAHGIPVEPAGQVTLSGPADVPLRSSTVQMLAMALHELLTNAVKHGALSQRTARLSIEWRLREDATGAPKLFVEWSERGVRLPDELRDGAAPLLRGQGRELIERALPYQIEAETSFQFAPDGVYCTLLLPISSRSAVRAAKPHQP